MQVIIVLTKNIVRSALDSPTKYSGIFLEKSAVLPFFLV